MERMLRLGTIIAVALVSAARAETLVDFSFVGFAGNETNVAPVAVNPALTVASAGYLKRGAGMGAAADIWSVTGFSAVNGPPSATTITDAITGDVYATFAFTVNSGYTVSLSALSFGWSRQNNQTRNFTVLASLDGGVTGFTTDKVVGTATVTTDATTPPTNATTIDLSGDARLQNIPAGTTVILRIYHYGTSNQYEGNAFSSKTPAGYPALPGLDLIGTASVVQAEQPVCTITAPADGTLYPYGSWPTAIPIGVTVTDNVAVTEVKFYESGSLVGTETNAPFTHNWAWPAAQGSNYYLVAHAYDGDGNIGTSQTVRVQAGVDHPPTVSIVSPPDGTYYAAGSYPASIAITATAADDSGVTQVTFYANGGTIGVDTGATYTLDWAWPAAQGLYTLTAVATDDGGHAVACSPIVIEALGAMPAGLLAYDDFSRTATGALHQAGSGVGWGARWRVQGGDTVVPGFNATDDAPLSYGHLVSSVRHASGGRAYLGCKRFLDVSPAGPFADYLVNGDIGAPGKDLWASYLARRDGVAAEPCQVTFGRGADNNDPQVTPACRTANVGGFWAIQHVTNGTVAATESTGKTCVQGETALLVLRFQFGVGGVSSNHVVSLYLNPTDYTLGVAPPATPDAVLNIAGDAAFQFDGIDFYPSASPLQGSFDEFRLGTSYAAVTPTTIARGTVVILR
jgi:hypothetical protein